MARQTRAAQKEAVEKRTQERLAARKEAAQRGAETRKRKREEMPPEVADKMAALKKHEAKLVAETRKMLDAEATAEAKAQEPQPQVTKRQTKRPEATTAQKGRAAGPMATVALRGEQAQRLRALAAKEGTSLSKLLVRMMEVFEAQAG